MWFRAGSSGDVAGFTFTNGFASSGGSIRAEGGDRVRIRDCSFQGNIATFDGAAPFARDGGSQLDVDNCSFSNNFAPHNGGAGNGVMGARLIFTGCTFEQNSTNVYSGALACDNGSMDVIECLFTQNASGDVAGAVYYYESSGLVSNNTFHANSSPGVWSGSVVVQSANPPTVRQNIFSGDTDGYGLSYPGPVGSHSCNVFWDNSGGRFRTAH